MFEIDIAQGAFASINYRTSFEECSIDTSYNTFGILLLLKLCTKNTSRYRYTLCRIMDRSTDSLDEKSTKCGTYNQTGEYVLC